MPRGLGTRGLGRGMQGKGRNGVVGLESGGGEEATWSPGTSPGGARGKFVDDGKLRKVSGRLFSDPASSARCVGYV